MVSVVLWDGWAVCLFAFFTKMRVQRIENGSK